MLNSIQTSILMCCLLSLTTPCSADRDNCYPEQAPFNPELCAATEPMAWDEARSHSEIPPNASGLGTIFYGVPPYMFTLSGEGFSFDSTDVVFTITTMTATVQIHSRDCGVALLTVMDACHTRLTRQLVTDNGRWVRLKKNASCEEIGGPYQTEFAENTLGAVVFSDRYKYAQRQSAFHWAYWHGDVCTDSLQKCPEDWPPYVRNQCDCEGQGSFGCWDLYGCIDYIRPATADNDVLWQDHCVWIKDRQCDPFGDCPACTCQIRGARKLYYKPGIEIWEWQCSE